MILINVSVITLSFYSLPAATENLGDYNISAISKCERNGTTKSQIRSEVSHKKIG